VTAFLSSPGIVCALGGDTAAVREALFAPQVGGVATTDFFSAERPLALGRVNAALPSLDGVANDLQSRNNALLLAAMNQLPLRELVAKHGAHRIGVILGTSTSGIGESELAIDTYVKTGVLPADYTYLKQELGSPARFVATQLGIKGPTAVISTACSSSAKALASAARWLEAGLVDAVIAGGADSLCRFTIAGFSALESVSDGRCNPMSKNRNGINIGEAAALFIVTRDEGAVRLAGWGETSDAHHLSAPEPQGKGAISAMQQALQRAQLNAVDYVNLHGTATPLNDSMESIAVSTVLGLNVPSSSTKPLTGHTLGAAGALEAAISYLTITDAGHRLPPHWFDGQRDDAIPQIRLVAPKETADVRTVLSNSFAFGGSNAALVLVRA